MALGTLLAWACFPPARVGRSSRLRHAEVVVKGLMQLSKTPQTICQACFCFFAEGVVLSIMVRNKGGANVGTAGLLSLRHHHASVITVTVIRVERERETERA